jgi:metal-sulfur cluster biosynthetic enzyme
MTVGLAGQIGGGLVVVVLPHRCARRNWVWLPPWGPDKITEEGRERALGFNV